MVGKTIKRLMDENGLTAQEVADRCGVSISTINRILSGRTPDPGIQTVSSILEAVGGSLGDIIGPDQRPETAESQKVDVAVVYVYERELDNKDKWIRRLFVLSCVLLAFLIAYIILDAGTGAFGVIRY